MHKLLLPLALIALLASAQADDRIRSVQSALKAQGFYYGDVNGTYSTETTAALRRYQIRNGLEVTGTLTDETLKSLGVTGGAAPAPAPAAPKPRPIPHGKSVPPESDRSFLQREEAARSTPAPAPVRPAPPRPTFEDRPERVPAPRLFADDLEDFFAGTPYATAPAEVQEDTLRRAQSLLASRGYYRAPIDGETGPATEEALLSYQRSRRLPLTGRLDLETLGELRLLPSRSSVPLKGFAAPRREPPVYRGIWVR